MYIHITSSIHLFIHLTSYIRQSVWANYMIVNNSGCIPQGAYILLGERDNVSQQSKLIHQKLQSMLGAMKGNPHVGNNGGA